MTRKHYVAIAEITKNILTGSTFLIPMVNTLADYFKRENEAFDKSKFRTACMNGANKIENSKEVGKTGNKVTDKQEYTRNNIMLDSEATLRVNRILSDCKKATVKMGEKNERIAEKIRKKNQD